MATLAGRKPSATYKNLLNIDNSNTGIDGTLRTVQDGEGTEGTLQLSTTGVNVTSGLTYNGNAITIAGAVTFSGAYAFTGTLTGATSITFPTSGTLISTAPGTSGNVLTSNGTGWESQALTDTSPRGVNNVSMYRGSSDPILTTAEYQNLSVRKLDSSSTLSYGSPIPFSGTISRLFVSCETAPSGGTFVLTIQVNGTDSALTCTVADGATTGSDITHSVSVSAGDILRFKYLKSGGTVSGSISASFKYMAT
jgi:hypothetical protein